MDGQALVVRVIKAFRAFRAVLVQDSVDCSLASAIQVLLVAALAVV